MSGPQCLSKQTGDRTECALLQFSLDLGKYYPFIRDNHPEDSFVKVFKFSVERKTMTTVLTDDNGFKIYSKGAPEVILQRCTQIVRKNGNVGKFLPEDKLRIDEIIKHMQEKSHLKVLCLASRYFYPSGKCMTILGSTTGYESVISLFAIQRKKGSEIKTQAQVFASVKSKSTFKV